MSILLVGANGNMGRRYRAILDYLGKEYVGVDKEHSAPYICDRARQSEGVIIATPTALHAEHVRLFLPHRVPILCEKPIIKNPQELKALFDEIKESKTPFRMINQYKMLDTPTSYGRSHYNYFKHGADGIYWDCLQIIGIARGEVTIAETSPIWRCTLNGRPIRLDHMDAAYIGYMQKWFSEPQQDLGELLAAHERTAEMDKKKWNTQQ